MPDGTTHVLIITDMSGSMGPLADDVRGGFNEYVDKLEADGVDVKVTCCLFDTVFIPHCVAVPPAKVPRFTEANYMPRGGTALFDAIGKTVAEFHLKNPELGPNDKVLVVIQTDGGENSSREYIRKEQIRDLIEAREATGKWVFVYLGAGQEAWQQGHSLGINPTQVVRTAATGRGVHTSYNTMYAGTVSVASAGPLDAGQVAEIFTDAEDPTP